MKLDLGSPVVTSIFLGGTDLVTVTEDGFVRVWSASDEDDRYRVAREARARARRDRAASERLTQAVVTGDGKFLVARSDAGAVMAVDLESDDGNVQDLENRFGDGGGLSAASDARKPGRHLGRRRQAGALGPAATPRSRFERGRPLDLLSGHEPLRHASRSGLTGEETRPRRPRALRTRRQVAKQTKLSGEQRASTSRPQASPSSTTAGCRSRVGDYLSYVATWDWEAQAKPVRSAR